MLPTTPGQLGEMHIRSLGPRYHQERTQDTVPAASSYFFRGPYDHGQRPSPGTNFGQRDYNPNAEEGNCSDKHQQTTHWVLFEIFPSTKEGWWTSAHSGLTATESIHKGVAFQNADNSIESIEPGEWFASIDLKDAYFHVPICQDHHPFSSLCLSRLGLPVQGPTIWPFIVSKGLHQSGFSSPSSSSVCRNKNSSIPGRLVNLCSFSQSSHEGHRNGNSVCTSSRSQSKLGQEQSKSSATDGVCGDFIGLPTNDGVFISSEGDKIVQSGSVISSEQESEACSVPAVAGYDCSGSNCDSPRSSQSSSATKMGEQRQLASQIRQTCEAEGYTEMYPDVTPLEDQEITITRGSFREHPSEAVCDNNRCLSDGMGSSLGRQVYQRFLGTSLDSGAHQCVGAQGSLPLSEGFFSRHCKTNMFW